MDTNSVMNCPVLASRLFGLGQLKLAFQSIRYIVTSQLVYAGYIGWTGSNERKCQRQRALHTKIIETRRQDRMRSDAW